MYFKVRFNDPIGESQFEDCGLDVDFNSVNGKEVVFYKNHKFEIVRNDSALVEELTFCNQCVQTYDIEEVFIVLIGNLILEDQTVNLYDSNGLEEILTKEELIEMY